MLSTRWVAPILAGFLTVTAAGAAAGQTMSPAAPKPAEQMPPAPPPADAPPPGTLQPGDAFGLEVMLPELTIVLTKGHANWDSAFDTLIASFKALHAYLDKEGIKPTGAAMTIYTKTDETGFDFEAAYPIAAAPASPPPDKIAVGQAPAGKALKFVHRGAYDAMDTTYETITNFLDDHSIDAKDMFIEQYATDPLVSNPDRLVIDIYVPIK
jgi:effector-binding domain-containing protein